MTFYKLKQLAIFIAFSLFVFSGIYTLSMIAFGLLGVANGF